MSYNTRRAGGGGDNRSSNRAPQTTQVNYHQQPAKAAANPVVRGYTTTNVQQTYNSSAQPAYSTSQPAYQTNPPLPKTAPPPQPQPTVASTPATPQQVKQEPPTPQGTPVASSENGEAASTKPFWAGKKRSVTKLSNKVKKQRQNAKLRRILNPKTALTFLNELKPGGIKFTMKEEPGWGFTATVEIDGQSYSGHGMTVSKAKVQASEHALRDMLLDKMSKAQTAAEVKEEKKEGEEASQDVSMDTDEKDEDGEPKSKKSRPQPPEDDLPWGSLAAFALHKLLLEWQRGATDLPSSANTSYEEEMTEDAYYARRGPGPGDFGGFPRRFGPPRPGPFPPPRGFGPFPPRAPAFMGLPPRRPPGNLPFGAKPAVPGPAMPMKKIPDDANQKHPVMLLNQLKPDVVYKETREGLAPNVRFIITVELDGKQYTGQGKNKKEAKKQAAIQALTPLGIRYTEGQ